MFFAQQQLRSPQLMALNIKTPLWTNFYRKGKLDDSVTAYVSGTIPVGHEVKLVAAIDRGEVDVKPPVLCAVARWTNTSLKDAQTGFFEPIISAHRASWLGFVITYGNGVHPPTDLDYTVIPGPTFDSTLDLFDSTQFRFDNVPGTYFVDSAGNFVDPNSLGPIDPALTVSAWLA